MEHDEQYADLQIELAMVYLSIAEEQKRLSLLNHV